MKIYHWEHHDSDFRRLILDFTHTNIKEKIRFNYWNQRTRICCKCKIKLPETTYFYASGGKDNYHRTCKICEGSPSYGWGRKYNKELNASGFHYCSKCDRVLPLNSLYFNRTNGKCNKTGYSSNCKECMGKESKFGLNSLNNYDEINDIKTNHKICHSCFVELPNDDYYFFKKNDRENGSTTCKECKGFKYGIERINKVLSHELDDFHRFCSICKEKKHLNDMSSPSNCKKCMKIRTKIHNAKPKTKERLRINVQIRRSRKNKLVSDLTKNQFNETLKYFNHSCAYCGLSEDEHRKIFGERLHCEHIVPLSKGGEFTKNNIIPSCRSCNASKSDKDLEVYYKKTNSFTEERLWKIIEFVKLFS